jgi:uncharacterized protein
VTHTQNAVQELVERGASLASLGWRLIDAHAHLGPWEGFYIPTPDAETMVAMMDRLGILMTGIASNLAISSDYARGNDLTSQAVYRFPHRLFGYVVPNPRYADDVLPELRRGLDQLGLCAIKLHPAVHNYGVLDAQCEPIWRFAEERGCPILIHTWEGDKRCSPAACAQVAAAHPSVPILLGHSGGTPGGRRESAQVAQERPNLYLELCSSRLMAAEVEWMVGQVGAERVIYGTDVPWIDPRFGLGKIAFTNLSDEQLRLVMGESMARLLRLP